MSVPLRRANTVHGIQSSGVQRIQPAFVSQGVSVASVGVSVASVAAPASRGYARAQTAPLVSSVGPSRFSAFSGSIGYTAFNSIGAADLTPLSPTARLSQTPTSFGSMPAAAFVAGGPQLSLPVMSARGTSSIGVAAFPPISPTSNVFVSQQEFTGGAVSSIQPESSSSPDTLTHRGQPYTPNPRSILVIGPGGGTKMNQPAYDGLRAAGWDLTIVHAPQYDRSPALPDYLYPPGWDTGSPDLSFNGGINLATLADNMVMSHIDQLIAAGRGPAAIIVGSRGGQVTLPRLWQLGWRGPVLCINGGCVPVSTIPGGATRLVLVTGGGDNFLTRDPNVTRQLLRKEDPTKPILMYHNPTDGHMPQSLGDVFGPLLEIAVNKDKFSSMVSAAAAGQAALTHPQAARHGVLLQAL